MFPKLRIDIRIQQLAVKLPGLSICDRRQHIVEFTFYDSNPGADLDLWIIPGLYFAVSIAVQDRFLRHKIPFAGEIPPHHVLHPMRGKRCRQAKVRDQGFNPVHGLHGAKGLPWMIHFDKEVTPQQRALHSLPDPRVRRPFLDLGRECPIAQRI